MKPTIEELKSTRISLEYACVPNEIVGFKVDYLKALSGAIRDYDSYGERELHNLVLGVQLLLDSM